MTTEELGPLLWLAPEPMQTLHTPTLPLALSLPSLRLRPEGVQSNSDGNVTGWTSTVEIGGNTISLGAAPADPKDPETSTHALSCF